MHINIFRPIKIILRRLGLGRNSKTDFKLCKKMTEESTTTGFRKNTATARYITELVADVQDALRPEKTPIGLMADMR